MNPKRLLVLFVLAALFLAGLWLPANAASDGQVQYATPTAGADGRIIYVVQPGDSCLRIALLNGISVEQLRDLNRNLDADCTVIEGQQLLIGLIGPAATPTSGPSPTPLPPTVTPTPLTGTTEICVLLFDDQNGNAMREENEPAVANGAISVIEANGAYSASQVTAINPDPEAYPGMCFSDVPEGSYNISVAPPDTYNPTMEMEYKLDVKAGQRVSIDFGAQSSQQTVENTGKNTDEGDGTSPLLGIVAAVLLLAGVGLGFFAWQANRPSSKLGRGSSLLRRFKK